MAKHQGPRSIPQARISADQRQAWRAELARQARQSRGRRGGGAPGYRPGMGRVAPAAAPDGEPGIAVATACADCASRYFPGRPGRPCLDGRAAIHIIHAGHVGELEADGWTVWADGMYGDGTPDVACPHIAPDVVT